MQAIGKHVWDAAVRDPIDLDDVALGTQAAQQEVYDGLYRSRWERATPAQQTLLRALAQTEMAEIAEDMREGLLALAAAPGCR